MSDRVELVTPEAAHDDSAGNELAQLLAQAVEQRSSPNAAIVSMACSSAHLSASATRPSRS